MKHTPGPWTTNGVFVYCDRKAKAICKMADSGPIAYAAGVGSTENEANALLIAAAPEMLEALKAANRLLHFLENLGVFADLEGDEVSAKFAAWDILKDAIAKAEGR